MIYEKLFRSKFASCKCLQYKYPISYVLEITIIFQTANITIFSTDEKTLFLLSNVKSFITKSILSFKVIYIINKHMALNYI